MKDSLKRNIALAAVLLLAWGGWYGWQSWKTKQALNALEDVVRSADLNKLFSDPPEEIRSSVDLAVRGIDLSQGANGRKSFQLTADWAALNQQSGALTVRQPDIVYNMEDDEDGSPRVVHASSKIGRVEDGNQKVSMSENVRATCDGNTLSGDLAIFVNGSRTLSFPGGAELNGPDIHGDAAFLIWDLDTNTLSGDYGVSIRWTPSPAEPSGGDTSAATPNTDAPAGAQEASLS